MSVVEETKVLAALRKFAGAVTAKMTALAPGEPEDQLRAPFETFMDEVGRAVVRNIVCTGETKLPGRLGKPDYAVHATGVLIGCVEMKAPGLGADPSRFAGHNRDQWKRFSAIPNLIYCDGNEWGLYRNGESVGKIVRLSGDVANDGKNAVGPGDAQRLFGLLTDFLSWQPFIPAITKGEIDLQGLAGLLIPVYIQAEVVMSFFGLGVGEPVPSWGNMLASPQNLTTLEHYWWMATRRFLSQAYVCCITRLRRIFRGRGEPERVLGERDGPTALGLIEKLSNAVGGGLQVSTGGFKPYVGTVEKVLGASLCS